MARTAKSSLILESIIVHYIKEGYNTVPKIANELMITDVYVHRLLQGLVTGGVVIKKVNVAGAGHLYEVIL